MSRGIFANVALLGAQMMFKQLKTASLWVTVLTFGIVNPLAGQDELLTQDKVPAIMEDIFRYHVEKKEMSPELMQRSLSVYIDQFDPEKAYLLESEVQPFLDPANFRLDQMVKDYQEGRLTYFEELHDVIQQSVRRAQRLRAELEANPRAIFRDADPETLRNAPDADELNYASGERELKERIRYQLVRFAAFQKTQHDEATLRGREADVFRLYERAKSAHELGYLFEDELNGALPDAEQEHRFVLHVLKAMAKSLDSHTAFFSYSEAYDMKVRLEKGFQGVGIVLQEGIDGVTITRLIEGGPAAREGSIEANDRIVSVDGVSSIDVSFNKVLEMIRGKGGSSVVLGIKRSSEGKKDQYFDVTLVREKITLDDNRVDVEYEIHDDGIIGKLTLYSFYEGDGGVSSVRDMRRAIRQLKKRGKIKGLVLDLRQNTGGFLLQAVKVAGLFIPSGVVVVSKYSTGQKRYFRDIDGHAYYEGPLVVLTSRVSASAAEIVAQALQDYGVGIVVGDSRTYGKGSIQHQTVTGAHDSSFFKVTVGRYYTVSGQTTQIRGVQADIKVPTAFHDNEVGEKFLDYPLPPDTIDASFADSLEDLDQEARRWYERHYVPSLAQPVQHWRDMLPELQSRSAHRLESNDAYQNFLEATSLHSEPSRRLSQVRDMQEEGAADLPMKEAVNIVKDMIEINSQSRASAEYEPIPAYRN